MVNRAETRIKVPPGEKRVKAPSSVKSSIISNLNLVQSVNGIC